MFGKHRRKPDELVEPDLPITPMLDMSFQLMAFFIFTFHPAPTEGQIAMALPKEEGGVATSTASVLDDKPVTFVVTVESGTDGGITSIKIIEKDAAATQAENLGTDPEKYRDALKERKAKLPKETVSKLTLQLDDGLVQEHVVRLLDVAINLGFEDVAPVPIDPTKR